MQLMRESEVPTAPRDRVYRASRLYAVLFAAAALALSAAMIFSPKAHDTPLPIFGAFILLALLVVRRFITARFLPSNWLVQMGDQGLFLHVRSYLNEPAPTDDATVVFLPFGEIRSARLVRETVKTPDPERQNTSNIQFVRWIEFELATDSAPLAAAIAAEYERRAPSVGHWYGKSSTLFRDYPLQMQTPPYLRVKWQVVPGAKSFLNSLRPYVEIAPEVKISADFSDLRGIDDEQKRKRLRELDQRGETIAATYLAMKTYGYDLTTATRFMNDLRRKEDLKH